MQRPHTGASHIWCSKWKSPEPDYGKGSWSVDVLFFSNLTSQSFICRSTATWVAKLPTNGCAVPGVQVDLAALWILTHTARDKAKQMHGLTIEALIIEEDLRGGSNLRRYISQHPLLTNTQDDKSSSDSQRYHLRAPLSAILWWTQKESARGKGVSQK